MYIKSIGALKRLTHAYFICFAEKIKKKLNFNLLNSSSLKPAVGVSYSDRMIVDGT